MNVYIAGKRVPLRPDMAIGKGGEADIYAIGGNLALKRFKPPDHPDFTLFPEQQREAAKRLATHQQKLPAFPKGLPDRVISPLELATDRQGAQILGYTMPLVQNADVLLRYGEKTFRQHGLGAQTVTAVFHDLHTTVSRLHDAGIVIGDFNDLNVLVRGTRAYLIDADSFQFGPFCCQVYTERFVDPLLCDKTALRPILRQPYSDNSDWYAFAVMLFRSLLLVDPYGGVYKPGSPSQHVPHPARPLHRITVFDTAVRYPKPAYRTDILPDELLQVFHQIFTRDERGIFPRPLLQNLAWTTCPHCQLEYARSACPACGGPVSPTHHAVVSVRGKVMAKQVVEAAGPIVWATTDDGTLRYLVHADGTFCREDNQAVFSGPLKPCMVFRLLSDRTLVGQGNQLVLLSDSAQPEHLQVDTCSGMPVFDTNGSTYFWVQDGQLMRTGTLGPERTGDVLCGQTRLWVGSHLGFGFYRAGELHVAFVFDPNRHGINDNVRLPAMHGQLVDVACKLARDRCWLLWCSNENGRLQRHAAVILGSGQVVATTSVEASASNWMASAQGALAIGALLLVPTDAGIVRLEVDQRQIVPTRTFPDTEPYVDAASRLLPGANGLYVVRDRTIHLLTMNGI